MAKPLKGNKGVVLAVNYPNTVLQGGLLPSQYVAITFRHAAITPTPHLSDRFRT
jgi:hypothetical protein